MDEGLTSSLRTVNLSTQNVQNRVSSLCSSRLAFLRVYVVQSSLSENGRVERLSMLIRKDACESAPGHHSTVPFLEQFEFLSKKPTHDVNKRCRIAF